MATLREAIQQAKQEPASERAQRLKQAILSGKMDGVAQKEGLDLSPFKIKGGASTTIAAAPTPTGRPGAPWESLPKPWEEGGVGYNIASKFGEAIVGGGEAVQEVGAAMTGDTSSLEGYRQFYGLTEPGKVDVRKLSPEERGLMAGEGITGAVSSTLGGAFAPVTGVIESTPMLKAVADPVMGAIGEVAKSGSGMLKEGLRSAGVQLSPEQEAVIDEGMGNLTNLFLLRTGEKAAEFKSLESAKTNAGKIIQEAMRKGDIGAAKTAIAELEALVQRPTSVTGRIAGGAAAGATEIAAPVMGGLRATISATPALAKAMAEKVIPPIVGKAVDSLEQDYYKWMGGTKPGVKILRKAEAKTAKMEAAGTTGRTPQRVLAEAGITPEVEGTKFSTARQASDLRAKTDPYTKAQQEAVAKLDAISAPVKTDALMEQAIRSIRTKENIAAGKAGKLEAEIRREFEAYKVEYGAELPASVVNEIKVARWKDTKFDFTQPLKGDTNYAIAKAAQKTIEDIAAKAGNKEIGQLNRDIGDVLEAAKFLESLDGNTIKGGRLGKYVGIIGGGAVGGFAGPVGGLIGMIGGNVFAELLMKREVAPIIRSAILKVVKETAPESLEAVKQWMNSPEAVQKLLKAPKVGAPQVAIEAPPIALPSRAPSSIEASEQARLKPNPEVFKKEEFAKANRVTSESIIPKEGESFEFSYVRNTDKAPRKGARFGQDIEPAGKYMTVGKLKESRPNMETGNIRFDNPLVIDFGDGYGKASNWKNVLSEKFEGKTGKELSKAIQDAGYDGIITVSEVGGKRYTSEVIALAVKKSQLTDIWQRANKKVK